MGCFASNSSNQRKMENQNKYLLQQDQIPIGQQPIQNETVVDSNKDQKLIKVQTQSQNNIENNPQTVEPQDQLIYNEDTYINELMQQFDDLTMLFNNMSQEFDQISQYLLSVSGNQQDPQ